MTRYFQILLIGLASFWLASGVFAQSPREQLAQMVAQLQKTPTDNALREQIIKLAHSMKPAPELPVEAERRMARGIAAFKGAKSPADYRDAVKEFELAARAAPWHGDAYFNLGVAQDKAEDYDGALRSLKWAQAALPGSKEVTSLMYEVEYRKEKSDSPAARAAKEAKAGLERLAGHWLPVEGDPRDWQALRARARYGETVFFRFRFLTQGEDKALFYRDHSHGKWEYTPDDPSTPIHTGTRTADGWQWRMKAGLLRACGDTPVVRPVAFEVLEQGNIIRTKSFTMVEDRGPNDPVLSVLRRQGHPITPGPGGCVVLEMSAMYVRAAP